jgi:chromosome segregation ATPase
MLDADCPRRIAIRCVKHNVPLKTVMGKSRSKRANWRNYNSNKRLRRRSWMKSARASKVAIPFTLLSSLSSYLQIDKTAPFHKQINELQTSLQPWHEKINQKKSSIDIAESEADALKQKAQQREQSRKGAQEAVAQAKTELKDKKQLLDTVASERLVVSGKIQDAQRSLNDARQKVQECRQEATAARQKFEEARNSQNESKTQNKVLESLNNLKSQGRVQGFHVRGLMVSSVHEEILI